jgi:hypothetical protein
MFLGWTHYTPPATKKEEKKSNCSKIEQNAGFNCRLVATGFLL